MGTFIKEGEIVEGQKCNIIARRFEFKKGGLRKDPITNKPMSLYELDFNSSVEICEKYIPPKEDSHNRDKVHCEVGDIIKGDAIRLYADTKRNSLKIIVEEGQSGRHGANICKTNIRTIGVIKTPFNIYIKLLGYSHNSDVKQIENQVKL